MSIWLQDETMTKVLRQCAYLFGIMLLFGVWSIYLGQDIGWDLRNYHYYNAYAFLHDRLNWDIAPAQLQTYLNPFFDVFNYFFLTTQKPRVTAFVLGALSGITAFFLFKSALLLFSEETRQRRIFYALLAAVLGMTGMAGIWQLGVTSNDTKVALFTTLALYCALREQGKYIVVAGLLMGLATGFKLTAACYAVGLLAGLSCYRDPSRENLVQVAWYIGAAIAGFVIANGYWMGVLYHHFGNPLFPYYNNIFHSPYADYSNYADGRYHPHTLWQYIFLPFYLLKSNQMLPDLGVHDPRLAVTFVLAIVFAVSFFYRRFTIEPRWRLVLIVFFVSYIAWLIQFTIYRYAIPLEIFAGLVIIYFIQAIFTKRPSQTWILVLVTLLVMVNTVVHDPAGRMKFNGQHYFEVNVPYLPPNPLIITATGAPISYVIPSFPRSARFVAISNNFVSPGRTNALQKYVTHVIENYRGPIFVLTVMPDKAAMPGLLRSYRLQSEQAQCKTFKTNVKDDFYLCPLKRI
jgi:hypothetical protein